MKELVNESQKSESKESIPQPIIGTDRTDADYSHEPPHQLHDLALTPEPIWFLADENSHNATGHSTHSARLFAVF